MFFFFINSFINNFTLIVRISTLSNHLFKYLKKQKQQLQEKPAPSKNQQHFWILYPSIKNLHQIFLAYFNLEIYHTFLFCSGYHICERKSDVESPGEEECKPLLPTTDLNKMPLGTEKEGISICYENPYGSL